MAESYDDFRRKRAAISRDKSARGREIGPLPAVADPARKNACLDDLRLYCETYFAARFPLAWGDDHLTLIADLQRVVIDGGQLAVAMPRGSGKTTLAEVAALWAVCYGHRSYVMVIGATETAAEAILDNLKAEIETNDTLAEDFPEVCHPIRSLEGINNRANGQTLDGERTRIDWTAKSVTLPWVPGAASRGAVVQVAGLTGSIRGAARVIDGRKIRPDLVICDDPQTDESARSPSQVQTRESILCGAVLGLAGPAVKIAAVMPCTVIRPRDLADRVLDRQLHPEWSGRRCKLLRAMPSAIELWDQFGDRLRHGLRQDPPDRSAAIEFYAANRAAMDAGADPTWPARFQPGQLSAIQFAMELYLLDPKAFWAEYQNEPQDDTDQTGAEPIDPRFVADKLSRTNRGECPANVTRLTCGIDVQKELIFWVVCGWADDFTGSVVDYGTYPKQPVSRFSASDPSPSLSSQPELATLPVEARVYAGLEAVAATVLGREWSRADGAQGLRVERALADSGWATDTVQLWARQTEAAAVVLASKGVSITATKAPIDEWKLVPGERRGPGWRVRANGAGRRLLSVDVNKWKSFVADRCMSAMGQAGSLTLFGASPTAHSLFCDHLAAERPIRVTANGRTVDEWQILPGRPDNHWFDCLVLAAVAASERGVRWSPAAAAGAKDHTPAPRKVKLSAVQGRRHSPRGVGV